MAKYKGTGIVFMRTWLQEKGLETPFLENLSKEEADVYQKTMNVSWVPIGIVDTFFDKSARLLFPELKPEEALREFGIALAKDNINGIYKIMVKILSLEYFMKQAARLWRTYHDSGEAHIERISETEIAFVVENYGSMPISFCESTTGYIQGLGMLSGLKKTEVHNKIIPDGMKWFIQY